MSYLRCRNWLCDLLKKLEVFGPWTKCKNTISSASQWQWTLKTETISWGFDIIFYLHYLHFIGKGCKHSIDFNSICICWRTLSWFSPPVTQYRLCPWNWRNNEEAPKKQHCVNKWKKQRRKHINLQNGEKDEGTNVRAR